MSTVDLPLLEDDLAAPGLIEPSQAIRPGVLPDLLRGHVIDVALTRARLDEDLLHHVFRHDVLRGVPARVTASVVVANLPWGKQIKIDRRGELFDATAAIVARAVGSGRARCSPRTRSSWSRGCANGSARRRSARGGSGCSGRHRASSSATELVGR